MRMLGTARSPKCPCSFSMKTRHTALPTACIAPSQQQTPVFLPGGTSQLGRAAPACHSPRGLRSFPAVPRFPRPDRSLPSLLRHRRLRSPPTCQCAQSSSREHLLHGMLGAAFVSCLHDHEHSCPLLDETQHHTSVSFHLQYCPVLSHDMMSFSSIPIQCAQNVFRWPFTAQQQLLFFVSALLRNRSRAPHQFRTAKGTIVHQRLPLFP
ncbi:hypothetical protein BD414DRAFT_260685 [Trametes punicea]|nr:hypothetical protein BD414DRAFT_260685 [Trametes punicea]